MAQLTITYKTYTHLSEVPQQHIPKLKKLSKGKFGIMADLVTAYQQGYMWDDYDDGNWTYKDKWDAMDRSIVIAYARNIPIGWCISDDAGLFNTYVNGKYRKLGIAQNLAYLWAQQNMDRMQTFMKGGHYVWKVVHTEDAEAILRTAAIRLGITKPRPRRKFTRVTHKLPTHA